MAIALLAVAAASAIAGTAYNIISANDADDAQQAQLKEQSLTERAAGAQAAAEQRRQLQRVIASQDALRAGRGTSLTSGTALSIYEDTLKTGEEDIATSRLNSDYRRQRYRYAAAASSAGARDATIGGALSGIGSVASQGYSIYKDK